MIGLRELASLLASAIVLFGSVLVPAGDQGTVAIESMGGDATRAIADEPVQLELAETTVFDLVTSQGAPTPPATLEGSFEEVRFLAGPGGDAAIGLADRDVPIPPGSSVEIHGFSGQLSIADEGSGVSVSMTGTATETEVVPPTNPSVRTQDGSATRIPVVNLTLNGDLVTAGIEQGGSFEEIGFTVDPSEEGSVPSLGVDGEVFPFEQTVRVRVANYVGAVVVAESDRDTVWLQLDGFGNVTILGEDYERRLHQQADVTVTNPNSQPDANFTFNPGQPQAEETVAFRSDANDDLAIRSWAWDFGDGTTSQAQHPEHTYDRSGTYEVTLTVTDAVGRQDTHTESVTVVNSRPVVSLSLDPASPVQGQPVTIEAQADDRDGEIGSYDWSIPNRTGLTGDEVNHTFTEQDSYEISVTVTDDEGARAEARQDITVQNAPPEAEFSVDPAEPMARQTVFLESTATDYGDGEVVDHRWEIPGLGTYEGELVKVEFPRDGPREVTLEARDDDGATTRTTETVTVRNAPPRADIQIRPTPINPGSPVEFTADVNDDDPIEQAKWVFSDGTERTGLTVSRSFSQGGTYDVTLRVQDADGAWTTVERTFDVNHEPTVALGPLGHDATDEVAVETSELFTLTARVDDPDGHDASLSWSVDGTPPTELGHCTLAPEGNESRMQCGWPDDGHHRIRVHVRDEQGATNTTATDALVLNRAPDLNPTVLADVVNVGERVTFDAFADDPDGLVESIVWRVDGEKTGVGPTFGHSFDEGGEHEVTAEARDDDGDVGTATVTVDVNAKPVVNLSYSPDDAVAGESITFSANAEDPDGPDSELTHEWTFDDGANATGAQASHAYDYGGTYIVELTVTDGAGAKVVRQQAIDIADPPLGADVSLSPSTPVVGNSVTFSVDVEDGRQIESIEWSFGDGVSQTTGEGVTSVSHTYEEPRTFPVTIEIDADHDQQRRLNTQVRVTGDDTYRVVFEPRLPDGGCLDVEAANTEVRAHNLQTGTTIALEDGDDEWQTAQPCTLRYGFSPGTWSLDDQLEVRVDAGPATHFETYRLSTDRPLEDRSLRLPQAPFTIDAVEVFSPTQESQSDEEASYANPADPVFVTGSVRWVDGTPADVDLDMSVTYRTPTDKTGFGATYYEANIGTDDSGTFETEVPAPVVATSPSGYEARTGPSVAYLPGQYDVDLRSFSGVYADSAGVSFVEDPAGIFATLDTDEPG